MYTIGIRMNKYKRALRQYRKLISDLEKVKIPVTRNDPILQLFTPNCEVRYFWIDGNNYFIQRQRWEGYRYDAMLGFTDQEQIARMKSHKPCNQKKTVFYYVTSAETQAELKKEVKKVG